MHMSMVLARGLCGRRSAKISADFKFLLAFQTAEKKRVFWHNKKAPKRYDSEYIGIAEGGARTRDLEVVLYLMIRATRSTD